MFRRPGSTASVRSMDCSDVHLLGSFCRVALTPFTIAMPRSTAEPTTIHCAGTCNKTAPYINPPMTIQNPATYSPYDITIPFRQECLLAGQASPPWGGCVSRTDEGKVTYARYRLALVPASHQGMKKELIPFRSRSEKISFLANALVKMFGQHRGEVVAESRSKRLQ